MAQFNEELIHKPRVLAITKVDLIDEELKEWISAELPEDLPHIFISAVTNYNVQELKDMLWNIMSKNR